MKNGDKPAYPRPGYEHSNDTTQAHYYHEEGITKRELFAAMAMQAMVHFNSYDIKEEVIKIAIGFADELLKQLES